MCKIEECESCLKWESLCAENLEEWLRTKQEIQSAARDAKRNPTPPTGNA
jgi:hypothetical protein